MNIKKAIALTGLVAATAGISPVAFAQAAGRFAQDAGFYAGAAVGQSRIKGACEGSTMTSGNNPNAGQGSGGTVGGPRSGFSGGQTGHSGSPVPCDDKDTGVKIFYGYQFNKNFGAEVGYVDLGKATANGMFNGSPALSIIKAKGLEVLGVGTLPIADKFAAYGKLGFFRWDVDWTLIDTSSKSALSVSDSGTDLTYGLGLKYDFAKNIGARLEWQRYKDLGNPETTGKSDVDLISLGIVFKY